jgi:hypothetical protein
MGIFLEWGTGVKTNAKGGADWRTARWKQWIQNNECDFTYVLKELRRRSKCVMTFPIALSMSPSSPSCVSAPRIGIVPLVPHCIECMNMVMRFFFFFFLIWSGWSIGSDPSPPLCPTSSHCQAQRKQASEHLVRGRERYYWYSLPSGENHHWAREVLGPTTHPTQGRPAKPSPASHLSLLLPTICNLRKPPCHLWSILWTNLIPWFWLISLKSQFFGVAGVKIMLSFRCPKSGKNSGRCGLW